jgi:ammonium transporter Rh
MAGAVLHPDMEAGIREAVRVATSPKTSEVRRRAMDAQGRVYKRRKSQAQVAQLPTSEAEPRATAAFLLGWQILMLILYLTCTRYDTTIDANNGSGGQAAIVQTYFTFQDVHVMIFIGFGFLMTFLRKYGFGAVGFNYLIGVCVIQWVILTDGMAHQAFQECPDIGAAAAASGLLCGRGCKFTDSTAGTCEWDAHYNIDISLVSLVGGDFGAATALITFGALLGKTSPLQTLFVVLVEMIFYSINFQLVATEMGAADVGGSMTIHAFGAYFGLAASMFLTPEKAKSHKDNASVYRSDLFSMIGTVFLWIYWPSFVGALASDEARGRVFVQTVFSLCASCSTAFAVSRLLRPGNKFDMVDIQNATLAGGVSIGAVGDMAIESGGAMAVGMAAGAISCIGYIYIQPMLEQKLGLHDTCGVHNLHGMPGVLGGLAAVFATLATDADGGDKYGSHTSLQKVYGGWEADESSGSQAWDQLAALLITLAMAISSGAATGFMATFIFPSTRPFVDDEYFAVPDEETPWYFGKNYAIATESVDAAAVEDYSSLPSTANDKARELMGAPGKYARDVANMKADMGTK